MSIITQPGLAIYMSLSERANNYTYLHAIQCPEDIMYTETKHIKSVNTPIICSDVNLDMLYINNAYVFLPSYHNRRDQHVFLSERRHS